MKKSGAKAPNRTPAPPHIKLFMQSSIDFHLMSKFHSQIIAVAFRQCSPSPVFSDRRRRIHSGLAAEAQNILHLKKTGKYMVHNYPKNPEAWAVMQSLITVRNYMNKF